MRLYAQPYGKPTSAIFITFNGNCKKALTYYQTCFGGALHFETFETQLAGYTEKPVVSGSLISDHIRIYGSDLVHDEGRILGNYISVFLHCESAENRKVLIEKLKFKTEYPFNGHNEAQKLVEIIDAFEVRWILGI